jgi:16S rRNA (cytosine967-C5)-methyltransferase
MTNKTRTARDIAIEVLNQFDPKLNYAGTILDKILNQTDEKQRATDLVLGTIRNQNAIDIVIEKFSGLNIRNISGELLNIIRAAVFELIYSPDTPEYSIVNEAAENTKTVGSKKQIGFVNAVLRQIARQITVRQIQLEKAEPPKTIPQTTLTGCQFNIRFLPDPTDKPVDYLSTVFSLPRWLIADWTGEFGLEQTWQICFASNRRPSVYIRPNRLKISAEKLLEKLHKADIGAEIVPETEMIKLISPQAIAKLPGFTDGLFTVQDITASQAVRLLRPQPDWTIFDFCAAPGVKTAQLAEVTYDSATIIATDIDKKRLEMVRENITRLGVKNVTIITYEQFEQKAAEVGLFDAVLLDVPCSNTAVLAKRIETRYRLKPKIIEELTKTQRDLLDKAASLIKPGGKLCYSTCSIQKAENSQTVKEFLQKYPNFSLESEQLFLPSVNKFDKDGGYIAIIVKLKSG